MLKPTLSIIIPAREEEKFLPGCLDSIFEAKKHFQGELEILVVINRCTDKTEEIAINRGCKIVKSEAKNLSAIRNVGVRSSQADYVLTIDADSRMSSNSLNAIYALMSKGQHVGGGVWIVPERISLGIIITALMILPEVIRGGVFCGMFFFNRRDFDAINGFNEELSSIEDIDFGKRLKAYGKTRGKKYKNFLTPYITTSCRKFDKLGDWYFVKRPRLLKELLGGKSQSASDKIWYDFPRE